MLFLITSPSPAEGKSTVAANLARALAFGGAQVLLVDADLRRGQLHQTLRLQLQPGLADLLAGHAPFSRVLQTDSVPNLWFIARGTHRRNPGDLLLQPELPQALARCRKKFDYVLLDSSPIFAADDVTALAPLVDATLLVIRSRFSRVPVVREALELLAHRQCRVLGLVLNRVNGAARSHPYYQYPAYAPSPALT